MNRALDVAREAAREAAELAQWRSGRGFETWVKSPGQPVTSVDLEVDALLRQRLLAAFPRHGFISEESRQVPAAEGEPSWFVDPIDGTRDFVRGRDGWCVSVALVEGGRATVAAIEAPACRLSFEADSQGARGQGAPIAVAPPEEDAPPRLPADRSLLSARLWREPFSARLVDKPNSLALRLAMVADGRADAMIDGRTLGAWDVAAADLLVRAAGGIVTDRHGRALSLRAGAGVAGVVAATPQWHSAMLGRLGEALAVLAARRREGRPSSSSRQ